MKLLHTLIMMFIGSFLIQYYLMPSIMVNDIKYITNNLGKAYMGVIMGIYMLLIETAMHDHQYSIISYKFYAFYAATLALFIYLYRKQIGVNDKQYLEGMIEHHSMAILTSEEIVKKTNDYNVAKIAKDIIQKQTDELAEMKAILDKL